MGCTPSRSSTSSPDPDNNNSDFRDDLDRLDPKLLPDPKCGIKIRLSPTQSQVDDEGTGRPARYYDRHTHYQVNMQLLKTLNSQDDEAVKKKHCHFHL